MTFAYFTKAWVKAIWHAESQVHISLITVVELMKIKDNIRELQEYLKQTDPSRIRTIKKNKTTERWYKAMRTTPEFVTNNSDIHIMEANKGKVTVAINKGEYEEKIKKFDNKWVEKKIFEVVEEKFIEKRLNAKIKRIIEENAKAIRD